MPIYLKAPQPDPAGPDGRGWNRVSLGAHYGSAFDRCALKPRDPATFMERFDTRRAAWGFGLRGICTLRGDCRNCPVYTDRTPFEIHAPVDRVLIRVHQRTGQDWSDALSTLRYEPYLMDRADGGWHARSQPLTWKQLTHVAGWVWDGFHRDQHSEGFWLRRAPSDNG